MRSKVTIRRVWIERACDTDPDTSFLGEFTDDATDNAIVREGEYSGMTIGELQNRICPACKGTGNAGGPDPDDDECPDCDGNGKLPYELPQRGREYRFFLPAMTGEETGNPESPVQDWKRMEDLNNGGWSFIGIIAKSDIVVNGVIQTVRSGGLWGIESDSGDSEFTEAETEELAQLSEVLAGLGLGKAAIKRAMGKVEHKDA